MSAKMDAKAIRIQSIEVARRLGVTELSTLPLLDAGLEMRPIEDLVKRLLALHAVVAVAYGFAPAKVIPWIEAEGLRPFLTSSEWSFVAEGVGDKGKFQVLVEAAWALAWGLGLAAEMDFAKLCSPVFVKMLPNLHASDRGELLRTRIRPLALPMIAGACDLAYCLHWAVRQAELTGKTIVGLKSYVVTERRRALEWTLCQEEWDEVPMDT
jgi:hypothetical protein